MRRFEDIRGSRHVPVAVVPRPVHRACRALAQAPRSLPQPSQPSTSADTMRAMTLVMLINLTEQVAGLRQQQASSAEQLTAMQKQQEDISQGISALVE